MNDTIEIDCYELSARLAAGERLLLLDVRQAWEHEVARIGESMLIALHTLPARVMEIPRDCDVVAYCHHGVRSLQAALFLRQHGIEARSLKGGVDQWSTTVDPNIPRY